jgi:diguanylate cyclase (GGDEF)-like protein/PAS domain S-box-containing protein
MAVFNHPAALAAPWRWALVHGIFILGQSVACLVAWRVNEDALDSDREARGALQKANLELVEAQVIANVGSWEWDIATDTMVWSPQLYRIFGVDEGISPTLAVFADRLHPDDREWVEAQIAPSCTAGQSLEYEARIVRADDGEVRWISARGRAVTAADGSVVRLAGTGQDITERKMAEARLERLAMTDRLTGLANRDRFNAMLHEALDHVDADRAVGVLLLDLDGFKDVNDGIGHYAGDLVLQEIARRLTAVVRGGDEVARLGGDEFIVLLAGIKGVEDAIAVAKNIRSRLDAPFNLEGIQVHVNASIGIVTSPRDGTDADTLLKKADVAMYRAKTLRTGWAVFEAAEDDIGTDRLTLVSDLRAAIHTGHLDVAYQPIVETGSRRVSALEALARWDHPQRGMIPPDQFIPLAEQADLIVPLTRVVLRKAVAACAAWRNAGHDVRVGVNLSIQVIESSDPVAIVTEELAVTGLAPEHLVLEITESALATDAERVHQALCALRDLGVCLGIDDSGPATPLCPT